MVERLFVSDGRVAAWIFVVLLLLYVSTAKGVLEYGDDISMLQVTSSIVERGDTAVPVGTPGSAVGVDGRHYSKYGLGQSLLAVPFYVVGSGLSRVVPDGRLIIDDLGFARNGATVYMVTLLGMLCSAGGVTLLYLTARSIGFRLWASVLGALSIGCGTLVWHYSRSFMTEPASLFFVMLCLFSLVRYRTSPKVGWVWVASIAGGMLLLLRSASAVVVLVFSLWLVWSEVRRLANGQADWRRLATILAAWLSVQVGTLLAIAVYNWVRFGSIVESGYGANASQFTTPLHVGLYGLTVSSGKGIFVYCPILIAAVIGWPRLWRANQEIATVSASLFIAVLLLYSKYFCWYGGGSWGPRFLTICVPVMGLGLIGLFDGCASRVCRLSLLMLSFASVLVQIASVLVPYVPYEAQMEATPQLFDLLLWHPAYSPVLITTLDLFSQKYPFDIAPTYYASPFLALVQSISVVLCASSLIAGHRVWSIQMNNRSLSNSSARGRMLRQH